MNQPHNVTLGTNSKMGPACASISRPTGATCPRDCPFLTGRCADGREIPKKHRCYAAGIEARRPDVAANWARGQWTSYAQWEKETGDKLVRLATRERGRRMTHFRPHVGGDFCLPSGRLDKRYARALARVCLRLAREAPHVKIWLYTHAWRELLAAERAGAGLLESFRLAHVVLFASVHTRREAKEAANAGFFLAVDLGEIPDASDAEPKVGFAGYRVAVCPHQRGKAASCVDCGHCPNGRGHVGFIQHR